MIVFLEDFTKSVEGEEFIETIDKMRPFLRKGILIIGTGDFFLYSIFCMQNQLIMTLVQRIIHDVIGISLDLIKHVRI